MPDDPMSIAVAALYLKATQPDLDITDPYELTDVQFQAAVALLTAQHALVGSYWNTVPQLVAALTSGAVTAGPGPQIAANQVNGPAATGTVDAVVPKEGATGWADNWMVYAKARNPNCMYLWMDFITRPAVQAQVAPSVGEAPANPKACDEIAKVDPAFCGTLHAQDGAFAASLAFARTPLADCGDARGTTCTGYDEWRQAWQEIRG